MSGVRQVSHNTTTAKEPRTLSTASLAGNAVCQVGRAARVAVPRRSVIKDDSICLLLAVTGDTAVHVPRRGRRLMPGHRHMLPVCVLDQTTGANTRRERAHHTPGCHRGHCLCLRRSACRCAQCTPGHACCTGLPRVPARRRPCRSPRLLRVALPLCSLASAPAHTLGAPSPPPPTARQLLMTTPRPRCLAAWCWLHRRPWRCCWPLPSSLAQRRQPPGG